MPPTKMPTPRASFIVAWGLWGACAPPLPTETVVAAGAPRDVSVAADLRFEPDAIVARLITELLDGRPSQKAYEFGSAGVSFADTERFLVSITSYRDHCGVALDIDAMEIDSQALGEGYLAAWRAPAGGAYEVHGQCVDMDPEVWGDDPATDLGSVAWRFAVTAGPSGAFDAQMAPILRDGAVPGYTDLVMLIDDAPHPVGPLILFQFEDDVPVYLDPTTLKAIDDGTRLFSYGWGAVPLDAL